MGPEVLGGLTSAPRQNPLLGSSCRSRTRGPHFLRPGPSHVGRLSPSLPGHLPSEPQLCTLDQLRFLLLWLLIRMLDVIYSRLAHSSVVNFRL